MSLTQVDIQVANMRLKNAWPDSVLTWAFEAFGEKAAMGTGFGLSGVVLMHMLSRMRPNACVFYLDTDLLFPEAYALKSRLEDRLGLRFLRVHSQLSLQDQAAQEGENLWSVNPDRCCFLRKMQPLQRFLSSKDAWITAVRRDQSPTRKNIALAEWEPAYDLVKINPLATWTEEDVRRYIDAHELPYNPMHDMGYPSVGCIPCTKPVQNGQNIRSGRWQEHVKMECGIHSYALEEKPVDNA